METKFRYNNLLWITLIIAIVALLGIGSLFVIALPREAEIILYYFFLVALFCSAVVYTIFSIKKGKWVASQVRSKLKKILH
jgi:hypothetical protein